MLKERFRFKPVDPQTTDERVFTFIQTRVIAAKLDQLREEMRPKPRGRLFPWEGTVVGERTINPRTYCFSLTLRNDGPDPVYYFVNERKVAEDVAPVLPGEEGHADFDAPVIYRLILYCEPGETASVRVRLLS